MYMKNTVTIPIMLLMRQKYAFNELKCKSDIGIRISDI